MKDYLLGELKKACNAQIPREVFLTSQLDNDLRHLIDYFGKKYNEVAINQEKENKIKEIGYSVGLGFDTWFQNRIGFYKNKWEEMIKYNGPVINFYKFLSETFRILDKCAWWVQNAYQKYSSAKETFKKLDSIAKHIEKTSEKNKIEIIYKAKKICKNNECKNWKAISQTKMSKKEHEKERQLLSLFAELLAYDEFNKSGYKNIIFLPERRNKQPDMVAEKKNKKVYIEVKQIRRTSEEDDALRSYSNYSGFVNRNFRQPLQKKIGDFICDAKRKFECVKACDRNSRFLVLDYQEGLDVVADLKDNQRNLDGIFSKDFFKNLGTTHNMHILRRKYL